MSYYNRSRYDRRDEIAKKVPQDWMRVDLIRVGIGYPEHIDLLQMKDFHRGTGNLMEGGYQHGGKQQYRPVRDENGIVTHLQETGKNATDQLVKPTVERAAEIRAARIAAFGQPEVGDRFIVVHKGRVVDVEVTMTDVATCLRTVAEESEWDDVEKTRTILCEEEHEYFRFGSYEITYMRDGVEVAEVIEIGSAYCSIGKLDTPTPDVQEAAQLKADIEAMNNEINLLARMAKDYIFNHKLEESGEGASVAAFKRELRAIRKNLLDLVDMDEESI